MSYAGKILRVDLTKKKITTSETSKYAKDFLGGIAINTRIYWEEVPSRIDPFDPENRIIFGCGPLAGTPAPSSGRMSITCKSPLKNSWSDSNIGQQFSAELKFAGYDHIVIRGQADKPLYLSIEDKDATLRDASSIWGRDTIETQEITKEELGDPEVKVVCIGPAGEKKVRFSAIRSGVKGTAARSGAGAVMGSKKLKAIAVRGTGAVNLHDADTFFELAYKAHRSIIEDPRVKIRRNMLALQYSGYEMTEWVGYGNLQTVGYPPEFADVEKMRKEFSRKYYLKNHACAACPVACLTVFHLPDLGPMETTCDGSGTWGFFTKIPSIEENEKFLMLAQRQGMDIVALANVIGFAMDLYEKGILSKEDTDGIPMEFGNPETALLMAEKVGRREGFGDILAEGVKIAAEKIGRGSERYAHHVRGLPFHGHDPRGFKGSGALAAVVEYKPFACEDFCELPIPELEKLAVEQFGSNAICNPHGYEAKHLGAIYADNMNLMADMLSICRMNTPWSWTWTPLTPEVMAPLVRAATGMEMSVEGLYTYTRKAKSLIRATEFREGVTREINRLPERFYEEPISSGRLHRGELIDRKRFDKMVEEYYITNGWDREGRPTNDILAELGLKDVAEALEKETGKILKQGP